MKTDECAATAKERNEKHPLRAVSVFAAIASVVLLSTVVCAALAGAESAPASPAQSAEKDAGMQMQGHMRGCPMCRTMTDSWKEMGDGADMSQAMKMRCQMMMNADVSKNDATSILGLKKDLALTPEQVQKLEQVLVESRQKASALLTPDQQKMLATVDDHPSSMKVLHKEMHEKMIQKMEAAGTSGAEGKDIKAPEGSAAPKK